MLKRILSLMMALLLIAACSSCGITRTEPAPIEEPSAFQEEVQPQAPSYDTPEPDNPPEAEQTFTIACYAPFETLAGSWLAAYLTKQGEGLGLTFGGSFYAEDYGDAYLEKLPAYAQAYDGLILEYSADDISRIVEMMDEVGTPWLSGWSEPRDYSQEGQPLLAPCLAIDRAELFSSMPAALLGLTAESWPEVPQENIAVLCVEHAIAPPIHRQTEAFQVGLTALDSSWADRIFTADISYSQGDEDTSHLLISQALDEHPEFTYWLIFADNETSLLASDRAVADSGLTRTSYLTCYGTLLDSIPFLGCISSWAWLADPAVVRADTLLQGLAAMLRGTGTPETLWKTDSAPGYILRQTALYWLTQDNAAEFCSWLNLTSGWDCYPNMKGTSIGRDAFSTAPGIYPPKGRPPVWDAFLTAFFTSDYNGRYTKSFPKGNPDDDGLMPYYDTLRDLVTENCLDRLMESRLPLSYDKNCLAESEQTRPGAVKASIYSEDEESVTYSFELELTLTKDSGSTRTIHQNGQVTVDKEENKVSHLYLNPVS